MLPPEGPSRTRISNFGIQFVFLALYLQSALSETRIAGGVAPAAVIAVATRWTSMATSRDGGGMGGPPPRRGGTTQRRYHVFHLDAEAEVPPNAA